MATKQLVTAEQLWEMPEVPGKRYELVYGELVEMPGSGFLHGLIVELVLRIVGAYVREHDLGLSLADGTSYVLRQKPDLIRIPDCSFVAWDRSPEGEMPEGYAYFPPNLTVEVVSPRDRAEDIRDKVSEYLEYGVQTVWALWPRHRSISVYKPGLPTLELGPEDELEGGDVLPGFKVRVKQLFEVRRKR